MQFYETVGVICKGNYFNFVFFKAGIWKIFCNSIYQL
jgi:hypothetical protein